MSHTGTLQDTRERNSSQESSNSTNLSNKLSVPGAAGGHVQEGEYDYQQGGADNMKSARYVSSMLCLFLSFNFLLYRSDVRWFHYVDCMLLTSLSINMQYLQNTVIKGLVYSYFTFCWFTDRDVRWRCFILTLSPPTHQTVYALLLPNLINTGK